MTIENIRNAVETSKAASAWARGVKLYAFDLLDGLEEAVTYAGRMPQNATELREWMLNGARDWKHYSWSGCALCYDVQIAKRLCTPSELKKTDGGCKRPNASEEWLDVQARALWQAFDIIRHAYYQLFNKEV